MTDVRPPPDLLASLAAAAADAARWPEALERCVAHVGSHSATLISVRASRESPQQLELLSDGLLRLSQDVMSEYVAEHFHHESEAWQFMMRHRVLRPMSDTSIWPGIDLERRADYRFHVGRTGIRRRVALGLHHDAAGSDAIAWQFPLRMPEVLPAQLGRIEALAPHLAGATALARLLSDLRAEHGAMLAALDRLDVAVCIVGEDRRPVSGNARFEALASAGDGLRRDALGRLAGIDDARSGALAAALADVLVGGPAGVPAARRDLALARRGGAAELLVTIEPVDAGELGLPGRRAFVTVIEPGNGWRGRGTRLVALYGLSPAEADVCARLLAGDTNEAIAKARCTSEETVRTQVTSVLRKTDTTSRATLAARALAIAPPVAPRTLRTSDADRSV